MRQATVAFLLLVGIAFQASLAAAGGGRTQLTAQEVQRIFIGKPWRNNVGTFLFRRDGTYHYERQWSGKSWDGHYRMSKEGVLIGNTTRYTFYRNGDGSYTYYHSRNGKYYPAEPGG